jgi:hypothetical protein
MKQTTSRKRPNLPHVPRSASNGPIDAATFELLAAWRLADATDDPEEIRAAEQELDEFKRTMNKNRTRAGEPLVYP